MTSPLFCPRCLASRSAERTCPLCAGALVPGPIRLGRYELLEELGSGGMGVVWRAFDSELRRAVALKMLKGTEPEDILRLQREARIAAALRHPNIVSVHDVGVADGHHYIAMDLVEGRSAASASPPLRRAIEIVRDAARAVHYAHTKGVIHRDLKPDNILVDREGRVCVADFGLAKHAERSNFSLTGVIIGTPSYMSPEQAAGKSKETDARCDVWGLGATLYFLIAGRPPHEGDSPYDVVGKVLNEDPAKLRAWKPKISPDVETIVMKCLDRDPSRRYATAEDLARDLERFLEGEEISARPPSLAFRVGRAMRRGKAWVAVALVVVVAVAALGSIGGLRKSRGSRLVREADALFAQGRFGDALSRYDEARGLGATVPEDRRRRCLDERARDERERKMARHVVISTEYLHQAQKKRRDPEPKYADWHGCVESAIAAIDEGLAVDPGWTEGYVARGKAKMEGGDLDGAIEDFTEALRREPDHPFARHERLKARVEAILLELECERTESARALAALARPDLAAAGSSRLDEGETRLAEVYALFLEEERPWEKTFARLGQLVSAYSDAGLYRLVGVIDLQIGRPTEGIRMLTRAVELGACDAGLFSYRGLAHARLDLNLEALADFGRVIALDPRHRFAHVNRAGILERLGRHDEAEADCRRALDLDPGCAEAYSTLAAIEHHRGRLDEALANAGRALQLNPRLTAALTNRAAIRVSRRDFPGAIADCNQAIEIDPHDGAAYGNRGQAYAEMGKWRESRDDFTEAIRRKPEEAWLYHGRARAWKELGNIDESMKDFDRALKSDPRYWQSYSRRGFLRAERMEWEAAIADLTEAIRIFPGSAETWFIRGFCRSRLGLWKEAVVDLDEALRLNPLHAGALGTRGYGRTILAKGREPEEREALLRGAVQDLEKFLRIAPDDPNARSLRAVLEKTRMELSE